MEKIAIIRIRGQTGIRKEIKDTLTMLKLYKKHSCVVVDSTPSILGMVKKIKDFVTWGIVDAKTLKELEKKGDKPYSLHPPIGGFERKGIKVSYSIGGVLGDRKEKINDLISRMI